MRYNSTGSQFNRREFLVSGAKMAAGIAAVNTIIGAAKPQSESVAQKYEDRHVTDERNAYVSHLSMVRRSENAVLAVWVERTADGESVCWRSITNGTPEPVKRTAPVFGHPIQPKSCGSHLLWCEYRSGRGTIVDALLDSDGVLRQEPVPVPIVQNANCGEFACSLTDDGPCWLLVEVWDESNVSLYLFAGTENKWVEQARIPSASRFCTRPRLAASGNSIHAAWDEYINGQYRVRTASIGRQGVNAPAYLPAPPDCWEMFPALVYGGKGELYAARCRERLVAFKGGAAGHHSELAAAVLEGTVWRDIASVNIDHAMNPWMAAYMGTRRFPFLCPSKDGARLLWEEKEAVHAMNPNLGRLCCLSLTSDGAKDRPKVAISGRCWFIIEEGRDDSNLYIATKTQWEPFQRPIPYELHQVNLNKPVEPRPARLQSNATAPLFQIRPVPAERPRLDDGSAQLFFGDLHLHSRFSLDLDGEHDELYHFARDVAKLDFAAFTENDYTMYTEPLSPVNWERICRNANFFNRPGEFTAFVGWEYTLQKVPGRSESKFSHRCVIFPGSNGKVYSWEDRKTPTPEALIKRFQGQRVLLHHHHARKVDITDDTFERNVEICSGWDDCMAREIFHTSLHEKLNQGFHIGFFGASDNHERNPGLGGALTGIWAAENTREAIFDAFWNRRIFATTGLRPDLRFSVSGTAMGGKTSTQKVPEIRLTVLCDVPVRSVEIIRDGEVVFTKDYNDDRVILSWEDSDCNPGDHYYYAHIIFEGDQPNLVWNLAPAYGGQAWTSPVLVKYRV